MENTSSSLTKDGLIKMIGLINGKVGTFRFIDGPEDWSNTSANVAKFDRRWDITFGDMQNGQGAGDSPSSRRLP